MKKKIERLQKTQNFSFIEGQYPAKDFFKNKKFDAKIQNSDGKVYFEKNNISAPDSWSETAVKIAASKYFRKGVHKKTFLENSIYDLIERLGAGLEKAFLESKIFNNKQETKKQIEEIKYILYSQRAAFNSPVWFNLGLKETYKVSSKSRHFRWNEKTKKVESISDAYKHPQVSACFIQSVDDNLESIFDLVKSEARLFKYGSGSGTNFSNLRSKYEDLSSGGTSSGLISFLEVLDKAAGAIKSGGTTRRAAKMVCLDVDHPEIMDFIKWKSSEEKKAKSLIAGGYSADLEGEAFRTVSGQNANNSVRVTDDFMRAVVKNKIWKLKSRTNANKNVFSVKAQDIWKEICQSAWECADPGLQFHDTIQKFHTCPNSGAINASNPCSEYMFLDDSACNLASLNLVKFLDSDLDFQVQEFIHVVQAMIEAQDVLVDFASYPTEKIALNSYNFRPLGLGFANLGSFIMRKGIAYDSNKARAWAGFISSLLSAAAYRKSALLAKKLGAFKGFKKNRVSMLSVIEGHEKFSKKINWDLLPKEFKNITLDNWNEALNLGKKYGFRNSQISAIAPTGTIGLVMDCDTTGIEPEFSLFKTKKLSGGGEMLLINQSVSFALQSLGYKDEKCKVLLDIISVNKSLRGTGLKPEELAVFACAVGENALSPEAHLKMMAAVQPFISGAISKTVNLPAQSSTSDIADVYFKAWTWGLKSVAVYRDSSKFVQPLNMQKNSQKNDALVLFPKCSQCGHETVLESGCYRCTNCGTTTACAS